MSSKEAIVARLRDEFDEFMDNLAQNPPGVGNGEFVEFPAEMRTEHGIGRFGYSELMNNELHYYAAPAYIHTPPVYKFDSFNYFKQVEDWVRGAPLKIAMNDIFHGVDEPVEIHPKKAKNQLQEVALLGDLVKRGSVVLVNPSVGSLYAAVTVGGKFAIHVTATEYNFEEMEDIIKESEITIIKDFPDHCILYMGKHDPPREFIHDKKVYMVPDPFSKMQAIDQKVRETDDYFQIQKLYKGKRPAFLPKFPKRYTYAPGTVKEIPDFWILSSFPLGYDHPDQKLDHQPQIFFEGVLPTEWTSHNDFEYLMANGVVYDVQGEGTYLSRRHTYPIPVGSRWVERSKSPTGVSAYIGSAHVFSRPGFMQHDGFCVVARDPYVILKERGVSTRDDCVIHSYHNSIIPTKEATQISVVAGYAWRLTRRAFKSFYNTGYTRHQSVTDWGEGVVIPTDWIDNRSYHFRPDQSGGEVMQWLPKGVMHRISSFCVGSITYIFSPKHLHSGGYIFPTTRDLNLMAPELSRDLVVYDPYSNSLRAEGVYDSYQNKTARNIDYAVHVLAQRKNTDPITSFDAKLPGVIDLIKMIPVEKAATMQVTQVNAAFSHISELIRWKGSGPYTQWVHLHSIRMSVPGVSPKGVVSLCGFDLSTFISEARSLHRSTWMYHDDFRLFRPVQTLLELNGAAIFCTVIGPLQCKIDISWHH